MSVNNAQNKASDKPFSLLVPAITKQVIEKKVDKEADYRNLSPLKTFNPVNPKVMPKKQCALRRKFDAAYKTRVLAAYDACDTPAARGALLRREGLYQARIIAWKHQQTAGKSVAAKGEKNARRIDHLIFEIEQLKKKMAQAEAIIDIQKKVSELFGMHIHSPSNNEQDL
jgi:hypothetical protein